MIGKAINYTSQKVIRSIVFEGVIWDIYYTSTSRCWIYLSMSINKEYLILVYYSHCPLSTPLSNTWERGLGRRDHCRPTVIPKAHKAMTWDSGTRENAQRLSLGQLLYQTGRDKR